MTLKRDGEGGGRFGGDGGVGGGGGTVEPGEVNWRSQEFFDWNHTTQIWGGVRGWRECQCRKKALRRSGKPKENSVKSNISTWLQSRGVHFAQSFDFFFGPTTVLYFFQFYYV